MIGSKGWCFEHWVGGFYPEDMPQDWWFSYYSNEFQTVLLPSEYIMRYELSDWQSWMDDVSQDFTFYVELKGDSDWPRAQHYLRVLEGQLGGLILSIEAPVTASQVEVLVKNAASYAPVSIDYQPLGVIDQDIDHLLGRLQINGCWREGMAPGGQWRFGTSAIVMRGDGVHNSPAELRALLESCIKSATSQGTVTLFFDGASPRIEDMQNTVAIGQLL